MKGKGSAAVPSVPLDDEQSLLVPAKNKTADVSLNNDSIHFLDILSQSSTPPSLLTVEEEEELKRNLLYQSTGSTSAVVMMCKGEKCPIADKCPLIKIDRQRAVNGWITSGPPATPLGKPCLVELNLLNEWTRMFYREYEIDKTNSFTEIGLIRELAEIELMLWRLNHAVSLSSEESMLVEKVDVGVDAKGNAISKKEITATFQAKEKLLNRKTKIIKLMVGDRQEQYKRDAALKQKSSEDASVSAAQLRQKLQRLMKTANEVSLQLSEKTGDLIEVASNTIPDLLPEE